MPSEFEPQINLETCYRAQENIVDTYKAVYGLRPDTYEGHDWLQQTNADPQVVIDFLRRSRFSDLLVPQEASFWRSPSADEVPEFNADDSLLTKTLIRVNRQPLSSAFEELAEVSAASLADLVIDDEPSKYFWYELSLILNYTQGEDRSAWQVISLESESPRLAASQVYFSNRLHLSDYQSGGVYSGHRSVDLEAVKRKPQSLEEVRYFNEQLLLIARS